ncbi:response regulator transcription factor [Altererythrobacter sp. KTW20L]|uniref:response regulator n=1 Tax=Altererythrobacter sp. KTW20L TaxID=2942210 RepID=UPI0020C09BA4|nr:response regulator transcription factor [Altererythrobacter sp. KTW20L]MCL6252339.1 response regulator transcription factor [Altererythrobacter sp. KTW20L]
MIADDHQFMCEGVRSVLQLAGMDVVDPVHDGDAALAAIKRHQPDVVILDIRMPVRDGLSTLQELRRTGDERPVVILTAYDKDNRVYGAVQAGASAVVLKQDGSAGLAEIVAKAARGEHSISPELATLAALYNQDKAAGLTSRDRQLVQAVGRGLRNREVAAELGIGEAAVKVALHRIYQKLEVRSRPELLNALRKSSILAD